MVVRNGKRRTREQLSLHRFPKLGYYIILTDTKETEKNYMHGLRDAMPEEMQGKLVIKVCNNSNADKLVDEALRMVSLQPQFREPWIVFDRDRVENFDQIISRAKDKGIKVGWSNPCIEIWFNAYFGEMPVYTDSVSCCNGFAERYRQTVGRKYKKSDADIYTKLCRYGNEKQAFSIAKQKLEEHKKKGNNAKPSDMCPATTVYELVEEIKNKIERV